MGEKKEKKQNKTKVLGGKSKEMIQLGHSK